MVYACDYCHFLFSSTDPVNQCPDCGKYTVRLATAAEENEFESRQSEVFLTATEV